MTKPNRAVRQAMMTRFGIAIRAYRLGFGWLDDPGCWLRISGPDHGLITLECATDDHLPKAPEPAGRLHRVWWAHPGGAADAAGVLRSLGVHRVKTAVRFTVDDDGHLVP